MHLTLPPGAKDPTFSPPQPLHASAAVAAFLAAAQAFRDDQTDVFNVEASVMVTNVRMALDAVLPRLGEVLAVRPKTDVDAILSLPNLARAVEHAASECVAPPAATRTELDAQYAALQRYREPALLVLRALASPLFAVDGVPLLKPELVDSIVAGNGVYNHGQDGVRAAALLRDHAAALAGKHPFTDAQLDAMHAHGAWIMDHVSPVGARVRKQPPLEASRVRDRLWTLLKLRYTELRKVGIELFGEDGVDAQVPRLGTRVQAAAPTEAKPADDKSAEGKPAARPTVPSKPA
jgi:hypothetical protein